MIVRRFAVAIVVAVALSGGLAALPGGAVRAHAAEGDAQAKRLFEQGNRAFDEGRYSDALAAYRASFELVARPSTLYNIAACRDRLGDLEGAFVDYGRFVSLAEKKDAGLVEQAKARLEVLRRTLLLPLEVVSSPPGAEVRLDGSASVAGHTPATFTVGIGPHDVRVDAPLHKGEVRHVDLTPGQHARVDVTLEAIGALSVTSEPPDATLAIDGQPEPPAPGRLSREIGPGQYRVTASKEGYETQTVDVTVVAGETAVAHVVLTRARTANAGGGGGGGGAGAPIGAGGAGAGSGRATDAPQGSGLRWAAIATGVFGVVAVGVAVEQGFEAKSDSDAAQKAAMGMGAKFDAKSYDAATSAETRMYVCYGFGGAALIGSAVLYYMGRGESTTGTTVAPTAGPTSLGFTLRTSF